MELFLGFRAITRQSGFTTGQCCSAATPDYWQEPTSQAAKHAARCHDIHTADTGH